MVSSQFGSLAKGFISGAVVTVSISYSLFMQQKSPENIEVTAKDNHAARFPYGKPVDLRQTLEYTGHSLCYDAARKQPLWVSELLTKESLKGNANRRHSKFKRDDQLPDELSAANTDFSKSGWSRGHMAAAGNFKFSQQAMDDTFYLTNIVPQDFDNNSGFWNRLETYCRDLTAKFDRVHVTTGPIYKANAVEGGKAYVRYEVVGENKLSTPTHLYKIIVADGGLKEGPAVAAFVVPNIAISREEDELSKYQVSVEELNSLTGFTFHPQLATQTTTNLCTSDHNACKLKNWKDLEIYFASKKVKHAKSQRDIENAVANLKKYNIKINGKLLDQIDKKEIELQSYSGNVQREYRKA